VTQASIASARSAVELAIGLVGQLALWLGFMTVLREAGLMRSLARGLAPLMRRLFPDVPAEHPAMGAIVMNISTTMLGLGNAATPFGLKAMQELDKLNPHKGVATNAMALFLAILVARWTQRLRRFAPPEATAQAASPGAEATSTELSAEAARAMAEAEAAVAERPPAPLWRKLAVLLVLAALGWALVRHVQATAAELSGFDIARGVLSEWLLPLLMLSVVALGFARRVKVYEVFVQAAKEGFQVGVTVIPFLVAILVAIGMFRAAGAMEALVSGGPLHQRPRLPGRGPAHGPHPPALRKRRAGGDDRGDARQRTGLLRGPSGQRPQRQHRDHLLRPGRLLRQLQVHTIRHTLWACLAADATGIIAATLVTWLFFGR
jgi:spore maturation protein SpmA